MLPLIPFEQLRFLTFHPGLGSTRGDLSANKVCCQKWHRLNTSNFEESTLNFLDWSLLN